jgi:Tfp pilus assembly protein PilF
MKHLVPIMWKKHPPNVAGYFEHGWERQFAVVRLDQDIPGAYQVVYHEYTHTLIHANLHWLPLWLDEGLADYYGGTKFENAKVYVGAPITRVQAMYGAVPIPLEELISVNPYVKYRGDDRKIDLFYAESWAFVHYSVFGDGMDRGAKLTSFFHKLESGEEQKKAFAEAFGSFDSMQNALDKYIRRFMFTAYVLPNTDQLKEKDFPARKLSVAETEAAIGGYRIWEHDVPEARELIEDALQEDPKLAEAHEYKGFLLFHDGKDEEARKEFATAYELDSTRFLSLYYSTMLSPFASSNEPEDQAKLRVGLRQIMKLNPQFAEAEVQLALWYVRQGELTTALGVSRRAEQLEPSRAGYHTLSARILHKLGRDKEAADFTSYVAKRWQGPDHNEAVELWEQLPDSVKGDEKLSREINIDLNGPLAISFAEGKVVSSSCGEDKEGVVLTLVDKEGQNQTFHSSGGFSSGFSDTIWYGTDHFSMCRHIEGMRAIVRYKPGEDKKFAGTIANLELRQELPSSVEKKVPKETVFAN